MSPGAAAPFRPAGIRIPAARAGASTRPRDDWRLILVMVTFVLAYAAVGLRMGLMAMAEPAEPQLARGERVPVRGEITDRRGNLLAANLPAYSLYANPREIKDPDEVARKLAGIFPDLDATALREKLGSGSSFVWIKRPIGPRQRQAVLDLGDPGLKFGARTMRIYPAGRSVAHILGSVRAESEEVRFADFVGAGGIEGHFDSALRDPGRLGRPLELSIDLTVQEALREVLSAGMKEYSAKGAAGVLLDVHTGEVLALVSLPDFDPNEEPKAFRGKPEQDPRFNRAVQGLYELGSTFKVLTSAIALDTGQVRPDSMLETGEPLVFGRFRIRDMHRMPPQLSVTDTVVRSSNVGAARLALRVGTQRMKDYLKRLGLFEPLPLELAEATRAAPLLPPKWTDLSTVTISFGHGLAASPLHLAAAYSAIANGGRRVRPTLLKGGREPGERVFSAETSAQMMRIMRQVVTRGTARLADLPGYEVGGKTGTADKPRPGGGYHADRVLATFAAVFPTSQPKYALVVSLDEPVDRSGKIAKREASRTAVPVARTALERIAPLLGMRPGPIDAPARVATIATAGQ